MQNKGLWMGFGVLILVAAVALYMVGQNPKAPQKATPQENSVATSPAASPTMASESSSAGTTASQEMTVVGDEYSYAPGTITLKAGEEVKLTFKNQGRLPHNLVVDELNIQTKTIGAGQEDTITVKASKSGTYTFYCSVGNHKQLGMEGTLTVK